MGVLPPFLQDGKLHNICLVLEGYEEYYYFNRILDFPCFKGTYHVELRNAKAASNIPSIFQAAYAKNFYEIIFVVCDRVAPFLRANLWEFGTMLRTTPQERKSTTSM